MAKQKREKKKGLLDKAIDAVTTRDEKEAAEQAGKEAAAARAKAAREATQRRMADSKAKAAEEKARAAEEKAKAAEKAAAEAKAKIARLEMKEKLAARREEVERKAMERAKARIRVHVVKPGDSLSKIAKEVYDDANRWPEIFEANKDKIKDPNLIHPGQELRIP